MNARIPVLLFIGLAAHASARIWTSADGRTLEAEFVSGSATQVTLKRASDGKTFTLELSRLGESDREFIRAQAGKGGESAGDPAPVEGEYAELITGSWKLARHGRLPYAVFGPKDLDGSKKYPLVVGASSNVGRLRSMPIWSFHGAKDKVVSVEGARRCAEELKRSKLFKYTEFPEGKHGILGQVLGDPKVHEWLFAQRR